MTKFAMTRVAILAGTVCAAACQTLEAEPNEEQRLNVDSEVMITGRAAIEAIPDTFEFAGVISSESRERSSALRAASEQMMRVRDELPALEGVSHFEISSSEMSVIAIRPHGCDGESFFGDTPRPTDCAPTSQLVVINLSIKAQPATLAGSMMSYASEIGLDRVELSEFSISDRDELIASVEKLALEDALDRAARFAEVSGGKLGRILAINDGSRQRSDWNDYSSLGPIVVTAQKREPVIVEVPIALEPAPETFTATVQLRAEITEK